MAIRPHLRASTTLLFLLAVSVTLSGFSLVRSQTTTFTSAASGKGWITYSFPSFDKSLLSLPANLTIRGNASISQGALQITPDSSNNAESYLAHQTGRVFFSKAFPLWAASSSAGATYVASFSTVFKVNIFRMNASLPGEGVAFVIASGLDAPPSGSDGGYLGLTNASTDGSSTNQFVAVELDTVKQPYDPDGNHVGLDINSVNSSYAVSLTPLGIQLGPPNNTNYMVWIDYNGTSRHIWVYMAEETRANLKPTVPVLNTSLDLSAFVRRKAYLGFSASTGDRYQLNCVLMWNITVEQLPDDDGAGPPRRKLGLLIGVPCGAAAIVIGLMAAAYIRTKRRKVGDDPDAVSRSTIDFKSIPGIPREFEYKELSKGTNHFDEGKKLGQGGYGVVYRANVAGDEGQSIEVAVKKFSGANTRGQEDFLSELSIINRLRHRNLVKLVGWCHQNGVLLLVYDYMPNGSLDRHLFGGPEAATLTWEQRYNVVAGVASALNYLHHEYDQMVIHRDIKPNNIMLDAAFNARLGDFGLARALETDKTSYTDILGVPGTLGYIAPECFHTGRASRESDVFAFGAVVLETVCGHRASCDNPAGSSALLEWVWRLHGARRVVDAVDQRLGEEFDEVDAERLLLLGLACSHPNPGKRPKTQAIVQILKRSAPAPTVPLSKPAFMWPALPVVHADDDGEVPSYSGTTSTPLTASTNYMSSSGWTRDEVSMEDTMAAKDASMG